MSNTMIKKSFLFKLSPPFVYRSLAPPNLLNVPKIIITCNVKLYNNLFVIFASLKDSLFITNFGI